jgi:lipoate---protein ligase
MLYLHNDSLNPYFNLAMEEYLMESLEEGQKYFLLWRNAPSVIIGRHQNTVEEVNAAFIKEKGINVVRRISGGGAVYHDLGNLNFSFIVKDSSAEPYDFSKFTMPVVRVLRKLGVMAESNSRNDLAIGGRKFSGNSQYIRRDKLLHHGTLLFDSNLDELENALNVQGDKIESKGVKSVRSRVTNISEHLDHDISVLEFRDLLLKGIGDEMEIVQRFLDEKTLEQVMQIMEKRYLSWDWNYGESPSYNMKKSKRYEQGKLEILLDVNDGRIKNCKFYGDFFGSRNLVELEKELIGHRYEEQEIAHLLGNIDVSSFFAGFTAEKLLDCLF